MNKTQVTDELCRALRTYIEEFGSENVEVLLPASWFKYSDKTGILGSVRVRFITENTVEVMSKGFFGGASFSRPYIINGI